MSVGKSHGSGTELAPVRAGFIAQLCCNSLGNLNKSGIFLGLTPLFARGGEPYNINSTMFLLWPFLGSYLSRNSARSSSKSMAQTESWFKRALDNSWIKKKGKPLWTLSIFLFYSFAFSYIPNPRAGILSGVVIPCCSPKVSFELGGSLSQEVPPFGQQGPGFAD